MRRSFMAIALTAILIATAGCSSLPPQITCRGVDQATCQRIAAKVIASKNAEDPKRRIVRLVITGERGSYELTRDDGSGESVIVD